MNATPHLARRLAHAGLVAAALLAPLASAQALLEHPDVEVRRQHGGAAVAPAIAAQGNQALRQIRAEVRLGLRAALAPPPLAAPPVLAGAATAAGPVARLAK